MIEPTERLLWAVVGAGVVGVMGLAVPVIGGAAPFVLLGVVLFAVADAVLAGAPGRVVVRRRFAERAVVGKDVLVDLELEAPFGASVEVTDSAPLLQPAWTTVTARLVPGETTTIHTRRRALRRGEGGRGRLAVRTLGPLGLIRRRARRDGVGDEVTVAIDTAAVLQTASRLVRGGDEAGSRRKRAIERGRELDSLRDYRRGDDVRLVDWKASARRGELVVKELVPETRQDVIVVVDSGRHMLGTVAPPVGVAGEAPRARHDEAVAVSLLVAAAAIEKGDRAGLCVLDDDIRAFVPPHEGRAQLGRLAQVLAGAAPSAVESAWQELAAELVRRQKRRALIVIVTDVVDEATARALARGLATLRGRHLALIVAIDDPGVARIGAAAPVASDPLAGFLPAAAAHLLAHRRRALAALEATGAVIVDAPSGRAGAAAVDAYLALKAAGRC